MLVTFAILILWLVCYVADCSFGLMPMLSGKGFGVIGREYHRLLTGAFLHGNALHLLANGATMLWVGRYLERMLGSKRFLLFGMAALILGQVLYCALFPDIDTVFGGSMLIYGYIGLIAAIRIKKTELPPLKLGTWGGNWIAVYAIVGNLPLLPFMNLSTVALHGVSFGVGLLLGLAFPKQPAQ